MIDLAAVNVRTLSPRLGTVLGWGFHILVMSEVRVAAAASKAIARVARASGYDALFGNPPPPSPTFSVSPGGLAVFSLLPITLRRVHPPELKRWTDEGRAMIVDAIEGERHIVIVAVYGYAISHKDHAANDDLLSDCLAWSGRQNVCVMLTGDLNETIHSSHVLNSAHELGMRRISPDSPSTAGKNTATSKALPIDHAFVNKALWESVVSSVFRYDLPLADHFPLVCSLLSSSSPISAWTWPSPPRHLPNQIVNPDLPFRVGARTFAEWSEEARKRIQDSFGVSVPTKLTRVASPVKPKPAHLPHEYVRICKLVSAIKHVQKLSHPQPPQIRSLTRRLESFNLEWDSTREALDDMLVQAARLLQTTCTNLHEAMMRKWRKKVRSWTIQGPEIHRYVKNDNPSRPLALVIDDHVTNHPELIIHELNTFWKSVEAWPDGCTDFQVWNDIEDRFVLFLPHIPCSVNITGHAIKQHVRLMGNGSHGCDGWSVAELKALPLGAWESFVALYLTSWPWNPPEQLILKRRTPIEKVNVGVPTAKQVRPIDVFSSLLRVVSSYICAMLRMWLRQLTHPTQTATHGGVLHAVMQMAYWTEVVLNSVTPVYAFSLDLSMMFNMLSTNVSGLIAKAAGLDEDTIRSLTWPLRCSKSIWKLPSNVVNPVVASERGLPQGMASSVLLAELNVACLVKKLHACLPRVTIVYVDDINVIAFSLADARKSLEIVVDFVRTFRLSLSLMKSALWGNDWAGLRALEATYGISPVHSLEALGATWQLTPRHKMEYIKEDARIRRVCERLLRISHLPAHVNVKAQVTSSTALAILDFLATSLKRHLQPLRHLVRKALNMKHGAPELVYNLPVSGMLDPMDRGYLSLLRMWIQAYNVPQFRDSLMSGHLSAKGGRLAAAYQESRDRGVTIDGDTITVGTLPGSPQFRLWAGWQAIRKNLVRSLKDLAFANLQARRPDKFGGDLKVAWKTMSRELARHSRYDAATLMKIWTGAIMNASHRHTLDPSVSPMCRCGEGEENLLHMMWRCPFRVRNRPFDLEWWADLPPASSMSLILTSVATPSLIADWRRVCKWALLVLQRRVDLDELPPPPPREPQDQNGHCVIVREDLGYVWCGKCFIARKSRDRVFLTNRECKKIHDMPTGEGQYTMSGTHLVRIWLTPWKRSSWRPRATCTKCGLQQWATSSFRKPCSGG